MPNGLAIVGLNAWYAGAQVLNDISLSVGRGQVVTLLGKNGAGKSTTLKSIMGIVSNRSGSVKWEGAELINLPSFKIARYGVAICPEERAIFSSLTVRENLLLPPQIGSSTITENDVLELFPNLRERLSTKQGTKLSGGEQQMLAIGRILRTGANLLLLDEPSEGLAPIVADHIFEIIPKLNEAGFTILLVEQQIDRILDIADRHYVIEQGHIVDEIEKAQARKRVAALHNYLTL